MQVLQSRQLRYADKILQSHSAAPSTKNNDKSDTITMNKLRRSIDEDASNSKRSRIALQQFDEAHQQFYDQHLVSMNRGGDDVVLPVTDTTDTPEVNATTDADALQQDEVMFESTDSLEFEVLLDVQNENTSRGNENDRTFPHRTEAEASIPSNTRMSPTISAGVRLMNILQKHTNDSKLYDDVVDLINHLGEEKHDFKIPLPSRKKLTTLLEDVLKFRQMKPKLVDVPIKSMINKSEIAVPVFDAQAVITKMLQDPKLMRPENIASEYDIFSGKSTSNIGEEYYDEVHTGTRWGVARSHYCGNDENALPCGLIVFYDKSHKDRHGALCVSPILFTLTLFNKTARSKVEFWDVLAYIPNLDHGTTKTSDPTISRTASSVAKCQDEHNCLYAALRQLKEANDSGGFPIHLKERNVVVKVWIHFIVGDIAGNNVLLGSYNNANANNPYRDCSCKSESFLDPNMVCTFRTKQEIDNLKATGDIKALKEASKHNIVNAFDTIPMGDPVNTIYQSTPPETLHAIASGIVPRMISCIGDGFKSKVISQTLHDLHLLLCRDLLASSEKDFPRPQTRNHILETTKTQASENVGNLFMLTCALHTQTGIDACNRAHISNVTRKGKIATMKKVLALSKWLNRRNLKRHMPKISLFIRNQVIPDLVKYFPRVEGSGWKFPKVHSLTKFADFIEWFGAGINFFGGQGESHLKHYMKHYANQTQQRPSNFAEQLANQHYNHSLFQHALNSLSKQLHRDVTTSTSVVSPSADNINGRGVHNITIGLHESSNNATNKTNTIKFHTSVEWKTKGAGKSIDKTLQYVLGGYCARKNEGRVMEIESYASIRLPNAPETLDNYSRCDTHTLYRVEATKGRNDWCMILTYELGMDDSNDDFDRFEYLCPARIHGFVKFITPGTYTPMLRQRHDDLVDYIHNEAIDDTLYVIVHTNKDEVSWRTIEKEFICPLELGDIDKTTFIFPANRIVNPLFAFPNRGSHEKEKGKSFFVSLPARYWPFYIDHIIDGGNCPGNGGFSQVVNIVED